MSMQGIYWEKGLLESCYFMFPCKPGRGGFSIGSSEMDCPDLLIKSKSNVYLCVGSANTGEPQDYFVTNDFDGPIRMAHSGDIFDFESERFKLV